MPRAPRLGVLNGPTVGQIEVPKAPNLLAARLQQQIMSGLLDEGADAMTLMSNGSTASRQGSRPLWRVAIFGAAHNELPVALISAISESIHDDIETLRRHAHSPEDQ